MTLEEELERVAEAAGGFAGEGEELAAVLPAEPGPGRRAYVCAYDGTEGRTWLALDADRTPMRRRAEVREAVSIAVLCELATEAAGDVDDLRRQLVTLRVTENPPGIDAAEEAALELERTLGAPPRLASPGYLDAVGAATQRLEYALGNDGPSPFVAAMQSAAGTVEALTAEVEDCYKGALE